MPSILIYFHKELKHIRWMRNQLAHEVSIDSDLCKPKDIEWITHFYDSILSGNDPLACLSKSKQLPAQKCTTSLNGSNKNKETQTNIFVEKPHKSLWKKIVSKIKRWFS